MEINDEGMIFTVTTLAGVAYADFTMEDEPVKWSGDPLAVRFVKAIFDTVGFTGDDGHLLSHNNIHPDQFYRFCNSPENGIMIIPPISYLEWAASLEHGGYSDPLSTMDSIAESAKYANPNVSEADKRNDVYRKGFYALHGLDIVIESPKGTVRRGTSPDGRKWANTMNAHYGYIAGTRGADGDSVDAYFGDDAEGENPSIFIVSQIFPDTGKFDEHKVMFGYPDSETAKKAYMGNFEAGWKGFGSISGRYSVESFKEWLAEQWPDPCAVTMDALFTEGELRSRARREIKYMEKRRRMLDRKDPVRFDEMVFASDYIAENSKLLFLKERADMDTKTALDSIAQIRRLVLDSTSLSGAEKFKLVKELSSIRASMKTALSGREKLKLVRRISEIRALFGQSVKQEAELQPEEIAEAGKTQETAGDGEEIQPENIRGVADTL